jgi:riboflavin kinase/FMN adenylyltransferase
MIIYEDFQNIPNDFAVCIGFFDGVHRGHQFLLQHLRQEALKRGLKSAVVTFRNHPRQLVEPDYHLQLIDTLPQRLDKLAATGIDACFLLTFTEEVRQLTARQFIQDILARQCHVRLLIIGYDHRFGRNRSEGFDDYVRYGQECGMEVIQEPVFDDGSGLHYSSSEVRRALERGDKELAKKLLGTN